MQQIKLNTSIFLIIITLLVFAGCKENPCELQKNTPESEYMSLEKWSHLVETGQAILRYDNGRMRELGEPNPFFTIKYQGYYANSRRYKLSNGLGGFSLYNLWRCKFEIFDTYSRRFKKLGGSPILIKNNYELFP